MNDFDDLLKQRIREEPFPLPETYAGRVFQTCANLREETAARPAVHPRRYRWATWAAAALAIFIAVPNVSPAAAAALGEVPILGALVEIITFRNYTYDDGHSQADVTVPELGGSAAADAVNQEIQAYTDQLIAQFEADCAALGEVYHALDVSSAVVTDTPDWFTLRVDAVRTMASGDQFVKLYHIDKTTGTQITLGDLFPAGSDYVAVLSAEILRQMETRMSADDSLFYFPEEFTAIAPDQNFYFDGDGQLVLVFDEYTVAPGAMGMPEFTILGDLVDTLQ